MIAAHDGWNRQSEMTRVVPLRKLGLSCGRTRNCGAGRFRASSAAHSRRNRRTMRASPRMSKECTDFVSRFRRKNVLELAGLLLDLGFAVHGKAVGEEALG